MVFLKLAWRNMMRNKRRTLIAGTAIGIGLGAIIFTDALMVGMERYMIRSATQPFFGEAQIHREGFRDTYDVDLTVSGADSILAELDREPRVAAAAPRVLAVAMASSPANMSGVSVVGVDPAREREISQVDDAIAQGTFFGEDGGRDIVIGSKLADLLEVELGDRVVVTATQAHTGDLAQELFLVSGIYHFNIDELDRALAFVRIDRARTMLGLPEAAHEIAIRFDAPDVARDTTLPFWDRYSRGGNEALSWETLMPQLVTLFEMSDFQMLVAGLLMFGIVAFGIANTLFMSLYERMFEFGVLRAVGTRARDLMRMIVYEAASLSVVAIAVGMLLGWVATVWVANVGIDYRDVEFAGVALRDRIYPTAVLSQYIIYPIWVFVLTTLVGFWPGVRAARIRPATAMRRHA